MKYQYRPRNVCSSMMCAEINDSVITSFQIVGGCPGNTQGVSKLVVGHKIDDVIKMLKGIMCRNGTSCPDQVATFLQDIKDKKIPPIE